jgi:DNA invertase Pin-like site-specific DNA recombinase
VDTPNADNFTVGILAMVAQKERELISQRTKAGLAEAKKRATVLGNPRLSEARLRAMTAIQEQKQAFAEQALITTLEIQGKGVKTLAQIADCMNKRGEKTPRGGADGQPRR